MSLAKRIVTIGLAGILLFSAVSFVGIQWAANIVADHNSRTFLANYADLLVPAVDIDDGVPQISIDNPAINRIPRDWQIAQSGRPVQRSQQLLTWLPVLPSSENGIRFQHTDGDGRLIDALQKTYRFGDDQLVIVTFGIDLDISKAYAAEQRSALRRQLMPLVVVIACVAAIMLWSLVAFIDRPIGKVRDELHDVENGKCRRMSENHPAELAALTRKINTLLEHNNTTLARYRQFASNVAHAIKTPLTALRLQAETKEVRSYLDSIDAIVERNLARARIAGAPAEASATINVDPQLQALARSYRKLSSTTIDLKIDVPLIFEGDAQDFVEAIGNLLENACRHASSNVTILATQGRVIITDDGPGIPVDQRSQMLKRGSQLDVADSGGGIGLAIASEIINSYGGTIELSDADNGGLSVAVFLPTLDFATMEPAT